MLAEHPASASRDDDRHVAMIQTPDGWMLAYTKSEHDRPFTAAELERAVTFESSTEHEITRALGLATDGQAAGA